LYGAGFARRLDSGRFVADGQGQFEAECGPLAGAFTGGSNVTTVLASDGADEEEAEACAFDLDLIVGCGPIETFEDACEFAWGEAEAGIGDSERSPGVALDGDAAGDVDAVGRVLDGVIE
jgi:hypothetical protein